MNKYFNKSVKWGLSVPALLIYKVGLNFSWIISYISKQRNMFKSYLYNGKLVITLQRDSAIILTNNVLISKLNTHI